MKRSPDSSSSLGALNLMSICPPTEEQKPESNHVYSREFQSIMLEEEEELELELELESVGQKKRRLSVEQVKALEKDFEVDNKLESERKAKLAHQLGLQPRQVAVWFQNRRARWKTKQLEKDYAVLKSNYDSLKQNVESLKCDNQALCNEIRKLKSKLNEEKDPEKEEALGSESDNSATEMGLTTTTKAWAVDFKDGSSDSDSSAILPSDQLLISSSSITYLNLWEVGTTGGAQKGSSLYVKMEEEDELFSEEACTFFSDDQAPTLPWDTPRNWT